MKVTFEKAYATWDTLFHNHTIDLTQAKFFDPWGVGLVCLKAIENKQQSGKKLLLPQDSEIISYLKRIHFDEFMDRLTYRNDVQALLTLPANERENHNVCEIVWSTYRDEFAARLASRVRRMFLAFGMSEEDEQRATALVGELGNNVYDHNEGAWPTDIGGSLIVAQHYPRARRIEIVVADPGVGFFGSLQQAKPDLKDDIEGIQLGLQGVTGRVGESRGNGLKLIQRWTVKEFNGILRIHSGSGLVTVDANGAQTRVVPKILGTLAELVVFYK
jgi:anti-sigma regulatory factor (Ser/Thr protein kinase)